MLNFNFFCCFYALALVMLPRLSLGLLKRTQTLSRLNSQRTYANTLSFHGILELSGGCNKKMLNFRFFCCFYALTLVRLPRLSLGLLKRTQTFSRLNSQRTSANTLSFYGILELRGGCNKKC